MNNAQRQGVEHHLHKLLSFIQDDNMRQSIINDVIDDVCRHIDERANWESLGEYCNPTDIELAFDDMFDEIIENSKIGEKYASSDDFAATDDKSIDNGEKWLKSSLLRLRQGLSLERTKCPNARMRMPSTRQLANSVFAMRVASFRWIISLALRMITSVRMALSLTRNKLFVV